MRVSSSEEEARRVGIGVSWVERGERWVGCWMLPRRE